MADFTVIYHPPAYGEIIPQAECKHDPAGHMMVLGLSVEPVNAKRPKGRHHIVIDGQFCMKCGWCWHCDTDASNAKTPAEPGSADWWDIWQIAKAEFGDKCWQFACRLSQLSETVGHLSRLLGFPQWPAQARAQHALRITRHLSIDKHGAPQKRPPLKFRMPRVRWEKWPSLYRRSAA